MNCRVCEEKVSDKENLTLHLVKHSVVELSKALFDLQLLLGNVNLLLLIVPCHKVGG